MTLTIQLPKCRKCSAKLVPFDRWQEKQNSTVCDNCIAVEPKTHLQKCAEAIESDPAAAVAAARELV